MQKRPTKSVPLDVLIVGAGPAGLGVAAAVQRAGVGRVAVVDRHEVGASFKRWPRETRLITPSFPAHGFGLLDLNAIVPRTSPAYYFRKEHISGRQYAHYLDFVSQHFELDIRTGVSVRRVQTKDGGFTITTSEGSIRARHAVWAAGEFQYPATSPFPGAELCRHTATLSSYAEMAGDDFVVIGGYESGMDAACHLILRGKRVRLIDAKDPFDTNSDDMSLTLSPFTFERLNCIRENERLSLVPNQRVVKVERDENIYTITDHSGQTYRTRATPILASGFVGSTTLVQDMFDRDPSGHALLTENDESTVTPGLYLAGPMVQHANHKFCFIYKYRQRFGIIARAIAERLGVDASAMEKEYRASGMFLDDLACCDNTCQC